MNLLARRLSGGGMRQILSLRRHLHNCASRPHL